MIQYNEKEAIEAINRVAATDDGRILLAELQRLCCWNETYVSFDSSSNTMYHAARRGVWGDVRNAIKPDHLKTIEYDYELKAENPNDRRSSSNTSTGGGRVAKRPSERASGSTSAS